MLTKLESDEVLEHDRLFSYCCEYFLYCRHQRRRDYPQRCKHFLIFSQGALWVVDDLLLGSSNVPQALAFLGLLTWWGTYLVYFTSTIHALGDCRLGWRTVGRVDYVSIIRWRSPRGQPATFVGDIALVFLTLLEKRWYEFYRNNEAFLGLSSSCDSEAAKVSILMQTANRYPFLWYDGSYCIRRLLILVLNHKSTTFLLLLTIQWWWGSILFVYYFHHRSDLFGSQDDLEDFRRLLMSSRIDDVGLWGPSCNLARNVAWRAELGSRASLWASQKVRIE